VTLNNCHNWLLNFIATRLLIIIYVLTRLDHLIVYESFEKFRGSGSYETTFADYFVTRRKQIKIYMKFCNRHKLPKRIV
jgi:hypothetical protein